MGIEVGPCCLICRQGATAGKQKHNMRSCAISICTIFGLPFNHPFRMLYEKAEYCEECLEEVYQADVTLGRLEIMKQALIRFQNKVYSKLGDNFFQIENLDSISVSYSDFEKGGEKMKAKKFSYDEIVKIVYEKLDKDSQNWERFSSEGKADIDTILETPEKTDAGTQTDKPVIECFGDSTDWACDDNYGGGDDDSVACDDTIASIISSVTGPSQLTSTQGSLDPFARPPINFEEKLYCTYDPENCKRYFFDNFNLDVHIKSFHEGNPRPYGCDSCSKSFIDETSLKHHYARVHTTGNSYVCEHCGKGFASQSILRYHYRKVHESKPEVHTCNFCSAPYSTKAALEEHEQEHRTNTSHFKCLFCSENLSSSSALRTHYASKHAEGMFKCEICEKNLASENGLRLHMITHTEAFKCDQCSFTGSSQSALSTHQQSHSNEKPFTCEICGSAYKYMKNLVAHRRVHTGEKPHVCHICSASFRERSYLKRHEESHSTEFNYQCPECGKQYKVGESLKKHMRTHKEGYVRKKRPSRAGKKRPRPRNKSPGKAGEGVVSKNSKAKNKGASLKKGGGRKGKKQHEGKSRNKKLSKGKGKRKAKKLKRDSDYEENSVELIETQKIEVETYSEEDMTQNEVNNAVASIQPSSSSHNRPSGRPVFINSVVYDNQFQPSTIDVSQIGPVTVMRTIDGREVEQGQQIQYQFGYM